MGSASASSNRRKVFQIRSNNYGKLEALRSLTIG